MITKWKFSTTKQYPLSKNSLIISNAILEYKITIKNPKY